MARGVALCWPLSAMANAERLAENRRWQRVQWHGACLAKAAPRRRYQSRRNRI